MVTAYPLSWPGSWPRTEVKDRLLGKQELWRIPVNGRLEPWTFADARAGLLKQLDLLGATGIVISSNFRVNPQGRLYADGRRPCDQGIAAYFNLDGVTLVVARDPYIEAEANMRTLTLAIQAIRSIAPHGGNYFMHRALTAFAAAPQAAVAIPSQPAALM